MEKKSRRVNWKVKALLALTGCLLICLFVNIAKVQALNKTTAWSFTGSSTGWTAGNAAGASAPGTNTTTTGTAFATFAYTGAAGNPAGSFQAVTGSTSRITHLGKITQTFVAPGTGTVNAKGMFDYYANSAGAVSAYVRLDIFDSTGNTFVGTLGGFTLSANTAWTNSGWSSNVALTGGTTYTIMATLKASTPNSGTNTTTVGIDNIVVNLAPTGLTSTGQTPNSINLSWTASTSTPGPSLYGYNVYRSTTSGGPYTKVNGSIIPSGTTTFSDTSLTANTTYYYVVTDVDTGKDGIGGNADDMESAYSAQLTQATPNITVTVGSLASYPPPSTVQQGTQNVAMLKFQLTANGNGATWTGGKLDKIGTNGNIGDATFDIYRDANGNGTFEPASDTLIGSGSFSAATGQVYTLTTAQTLSATSQQYFIVFDIGISATTSTTIGARIASNTYYTVTGGAVGTVTSTSSATPTINAGTCIRSAPTVTVAPATGSIPRSGGTSVYTATVTNNDNYFCSSSTFNLSPSTETGQTGSFSLPSVLSPTSCILGYQGTCGSTLTVTALAGKADNDSLTTTVMARDTVNHTGMDGTASATTSIHDYMLHNSAVLNSSKWSGNGGWGLTGAKYGRFVCTTCHTKSTTNIKRINTTIATPDGTAWGSTGGVTITGVNLQSTTSPNGFGDDTSTHATSSKICEVCHSQTGFHKYNQTAATHQNNTDCLASCHSHNQGFKGDGPCLNCHNAAISEVYNTRNVSSDFTTNASRHVFGGTVSNWDCIVCHAEGDAVAASTGSGYVDTNNHRNGATSTTRMVKLRNVDNISQTYDWNKNVKSEQMYTDMDTFCLNCHDADGAKAINVKATSNGVNLNATRAMTPFNPSDGLGSGAKAGSFELTGYFKTKVLDVKSMFQSTLSHHAVLSQAYNSINSNWNAGAWVTRTLKNNTQLTTVRETARLHCADCHTVDVNAHSGANNAMLQASTVDGTCFLCHNNTTAYAKSPTNATYARWSHSEEGSAWGVGAGPYGGDCRQCHGGNPAQSYQGTSFFYGGIHGIPNVQSPDPRSSRTRYRFTGGVYMSADPNSDGTFSSQTAGTGTCYFSTSAKTQPFSSCGQHQTSTTGRLNSINYTRGRPGEY